MIITSTFSKVSLFTRCTLGFSSVSSVDFSLVSFASSSIALLLWKVISNSVGVSSNSAGSIFDRNSCAFSLFLSRKFCDSSGSRCASSPCSFSKALKPSLGRAELRHEETRKTNTANILQVSMVRSDENSMSPAASGRLIYSDDPRGRV